jgi:hypothetical protein
MNKKAHSILTLIFLIAFTNSITEKALPKVNDLKPDIVMIDTGTLKSYRGAIRMESTCKNKCWHGHGERMAKALNDEVEYQQFDKEVFVRQLVWEDSKDIPRLIRKAAYLRPKVIIMAIAGDGAILEEFQAVKYAVSRGITVVAAAGNNARPTPEYPAAYDLPCLISVSTKEYGFKVGSANVGEVYLDRMSGEHGTSFSTARSAAHVLGFYKRFKNLNCHRVKELMIQQFGSTQ